MPRPRYEKLEPERKQAIQLAAAREFAAAGYEGASLNRILDAAGVSKGAFYYWFDDKADLFATALAAMEEDVLSAAAFDADSLDAASFWPGLHALFVASIAYAVANPWTMGLARAFYQLPDDVRRAAGIERYVAWRQAWLDGLTARGQALGVIRDDLPAALVGRLLFAVSEVFDRWALDHGAGPDTDAGEGAAEWTALADVAVDVMQGMTRPAKEIS